MQAKRSEVLFVDYIAEHLSPRGRAGVIVPEGIIFQSQRAYKELRRRLVEDWGLWAVVSLPAGVFNPYSGVKTSILFLDKTVAKGADEILFVRVSADGFDLGAQRRPVAENDLPQVRKILSARKRGEKLDGSEMALWTAKEKIAEDGEYNLSAERYRVAVDYSNAKWPMVKLGEVVSEMKAGFACGKSNKDSEGIIHLRPMNLTISGEFVLENSKYIAEEEAENRAEYFIEEGDVLFNNTNSKELVGKTCVVNKKIKALYSNHITRIRVDRNKYKSKLLALIFYKLWNDDIFLRLCNKWVGQAGINLTTLSEIKIPLPPLAVQEEIVAEVDGYQRVIDGARLAIAHWKPTIRINPDWPKVKLGEVILDMKDGGTPSRKILQNFGGDINWCVVKDIRPEIWETKETLTPLGLKNSSAKVWPANSIIISLGASIGNIGVAKVPTATKQGLSGIVVDEKKVMPQFLRYLLEQKKEFIQSLATGVTIKRSPANATAESANDPSPAARRAAAHRRRDSRGGKSHRRLPSSD